MSDLLWANVLLDSVGALLLLLLIFGHKLSSTAHLRLEQRVMQHLMIINLTLCLTDICANFVNDNVFLFSRELGYLLNVFYFIAMPSIILLWCSYMELRIHGTLRHMLGWRGALVALPAGCVIVCALVNLFHDVIFTVGQDCVYRRLPIGAAAFWITLGYVGYSLIRFLVYRHYDKRYTFSPIYVFLLPLTLGCVAQLINERLSALSVCIAIGFAAMQVVLQNELAYIDPLTGVFNRQYLNNYLSQAIREVQREDSRRRLACIMIDVDRFKQLNDTYGHLAGDDALHDLGLVLREAISGQTVATRFGGDEFVIVTLLEEGEVVDDVVKAILNRLDAYNSSGEHPFTLSLSIGTAYFARNADTIDSFFKRMDEAMYRNKRR